MTTYKVTGPRGFREYAEGDEFEADFSEERERDLKERGLIRVVKRDDKPKEEKNA